MRTIIDPFLRDGFARYLESDLGGREKLVPDRQDAALLDDRQTPLPVRQRLRNDFQSHTVPLPGLAAFDVSGLSLLVHLEHPRK